MARPVDAAEDGASITDANTTHSKCRGVWIGVSQSIDLYMKSGWQTFKGAQAGSIIPAQATGARLTAGGASPASGDVLFLY